MKSKPQPLRNALLSLIAAFLLISTMGCDRIQNTINNWRGAEPAAKAFRTNELYFQTATAELKLSESDKPYLVFDTPGNALELRLKGVVVLRTPIEIVEVDRGALKSFIDQFTERKNLLVRPVAGKYLFAAQEQTPDSILKIVSGAINVAPELMQREIPSRFRLFWSEKLILDIVSGVEAKKPQDVKGKFQTKLQNTMMEARYVLRRPFGATMVVLKVSPEDAMTLYRVAEPGLPTLLDLVPPPAASEPKPQVSHKKK